MKKTEESIKAKINRKTGEIVERIRTAILDQHGSEVLDPKPMFHDIGFKKPPSLDQKIKMMVQAQMMQAREELGDDFEDENDFSDEDGFDIVSRYEVDAMAEEFPVPQEERPAPPEVSGESPTPTISDTGQEKPTDAAVQS